jgi:PadR family transcriptional regulator PadR
VRPEVSRDALGDLEHQVLLATLRLKGEAYSVSVVMEIEERTHRSPAQSAVFIALRRLEEKGLLRSFLEKRDGEAGRNRRYFQITPVGMERLREMRESLLGLWDGIAAELDGAS